ADDEVAVFQRWKADAYGEVESFPDDVHPAVGALQQNLDLRTLLHEAGDHLADLKIDDRGRATHAHHALRFGAHPIDDVLGGLGLDHHRHAMLVICATDLGDGKASGR